MRLFQAEKAVDHRMAGVKKRRDPEGDEQLEGIVGRRHGQEFRRLHFAGQPKRDGDDDETVKPHGQARDTFHYARGAES